MMERHYNFAGVDITLAIPEERAYVNDRALTAFVSEPGVDPHRYDFRFVESLSAPAGEQMAEPGGFLAYADGKNDIRYFGSVQNGWESAYLRVSHRGKVHDIEVKNASVPGRIGTHTVLSALSAEHLVLDGDGVVLHASYILWDGKAILFTAPSGTGKSTQADLWKNLRNARIINGDRAVIRIKDGQALACGIPFAGSSEYCENVSAPLAAIVYLGQAPKTQITRLTGFRAFRRIWEGCSVNTWLRSDVERATEIVEAIIRRVPVFHLPCTPDESAVLALEGELP